MEQIRQFRFEDFKADKLEQGYKEALERLWAPKPENEIPQHEFTAEENVHEGEFLCTN